MLSLRDEGVAKFFALADVAFGAQPRQFPYPPDEAGALGHADGSPCVEQIEGVRAFQSVVVSREDEVLLEKSFRFGSTKTPRAAYCQKQSQSPIEPNFVQSHSDVF